VNNNDDTVTVVRLAVAVGERVSAGTLILEVETEKAAIAVEAERDGYVLALLCQEGDTIGVGAVAVWLGDQPDEAVPCAEPQSPVPPAAEDAITGKARLLLRRHGLTAEMIPRRGPRLTAADVEAFLAGVRTDAPGLESPGAMPMDDLPAAADAPTAVRLVAADDPPGAIDASTSVSRVAARVRDLSAIAVPLAVAPLAAVPRVAAPTDDLPAAADAMPLRSGERAVLATVSWQRDHAAAAWLELEYDPRPWQAFGAAFGGERRPLLNPTLALMAHRLALLAAATGANGTILEDAAPRRLTYRQVNLGFTVQAGGVLYLVVVEAAETLDPAAFVARLGELQRRAMAHRLAPAETRGATVGFTSMARWGVRRHMPILAPYSALMVAHGAASDDGARAVLGVTYDHRMLSGFDAVRLLRLLADPAGDIPRPRS
jgi:pyruvate/2-oxoglutarate dehydrogenase complex dihydrolipoamide acyltransferase (E2) component